MNYVCARLRSTKGAHKRLTSHNTRRIPPGYLRRDADSETHHVGLKGERHVFFAEDVDSNRVICDDLDDREKWIRSDYKKRHGRAMPKNSVPFTELFVTFSPEPFRNGEIDLQEWRVACARFAHMVRRRTGGRVVYLSFHFDEATPHAHILFENYNRETGRSWLRAFGRKGCRELQDLAGETFAPLGFERGAEKSITGARHLSLVESHAEERRRLENRISELRKEIEERGTERKKLIQEVRELEEDAAIRKSIYRRYDEETRRKKEELRSLNAALVAEMEAANIIR